MLYMHDDPQFDYKSFDISASAADLEFKVGGKIGDSNWSRPIGRTIRRARKGGGGGGGIGRGRALEPFDPNAEDGDGDGMVQDSTRWQRPARPRVPKELTGGQSRRSRAAGLFEVEPIADDLNFEDLADDVSPPTAKLGPFSVANPDSEKAKEIERLLEEIWPDPKESAKLFNEDFDTWVLPVARKLGLEPDQVRLFLKARRGTGKDPVHKPWRELDPDTSPTTRQLLEATKDLEAYIAENVGGRHLAFANEERADKIVASQAGTPISDAIKRVDGEIAKVEAELANQLDNFTIDALPLMSENPAPGEGQAAVAYQLFFKLTNNADYLSTLHSRRRGLLELQKRSDTFPKRTVKERVRTNKVPIIESVGGDTQAIITDEVGDGIDETIQTTRRAPKTLQVVYPDGTTSRDDAEITRVRNEARKAIRESNKTYEKALKAQQHAATKRRKEIEAFLKADGVKGELLKSRTDDEFRKRLAAGEFPEVQDAIDAHEQARLAHAEVMRNHRATARIRLQHEPAERDKESKRFIAGMRDGVRRPGDKQDTDAGDVTKGTERAISAFDSGARRAGKATSASERAARRASEQRLRVMRSSVRRYTPGGKDLEAFPDWDQLDSLQQEALPFEKEIERLDLRAEIEADIKDLISELQDATRGDRKTAIKNQIAAKERELESLPDAKDIPRLREEQLKQLEMIRAKEAAIVEAFYQSWIGDRQFRKKVDVAIRNRFLGNYGREITNQEVDAAYEMALEDLFYQLTNRGKNGKRNPAGRNNYARKMRVTPNSGPGTDIFERKADLRDAEKTLRAAIQAAYPDWDEKQVLKTIEKTKAAVQVADPDWDEKQVLKTIEKTKAAIQAAHPDWDEKQVEETIEKTKAVKQAQAQYDEVIDAERERLSGRVRAQLVQISAENSWHGRLNWVSSDEAIKRKTDEARRKTVIQVLGGQRQGTDRGIVAFLQRLQDDKKKTPEQKRKEWVAHLSGRQSEARARLTPKAITRNPREKGIGSSDPITIANNERRLALVKSLSENPEVALKQAQKELTKARAEQRGIEAQRMATRLSYAVQELGRWKNIASRNLKNDRQQDGLDAPSPAEVAEYVNAHPMVESTRERIQRILEDISELFDDDIVVKNVPKPGGGTATVTLSALDALAPNMLGGDEAARQGINEVDVELVQRARDMIAKSNGARAEVSRKQKELKRTIQKMRDAQDDRTKEIYDRQAQDIQKEIDRIRKDIDEDIKPEWSDWLAQIGNQGRTVPRGSRKAPKRSPNPDDGIDDIETVGRTRFAEGTTLAGMADVDEGDLRRFLDDLTGMELPPNSTGSREEAAQISGLITMPGSALEKQDIGLTRDDALTIEEQAILNLWWGLNIDGLPEYSRPLGDAPSIVAYYKRINPATTYHEKKIREIHNRALKKLRKLVKYMNPDSPFSDRLGDDGTLLQGKSLWQRSTEYQELAFRAYFEHVIVPAIRGEIPMWDSKSHDEEFAFKAVSPTEIPLNPSNAVPDVLPQERVTGDILRGYGPRRGNLERLLRYWRPIMRREGGFRRCRVILADHPELYPLEPLCAWLHHETTGLWPNEGCHHPGMKNCRRKLKRVVRGSIWSDSDFNDRLQRVTSGKLNVRVPGGKMPSIPGKSAMGFAYDEEPADENMKPVRSMVPDLSDDDIAALSDKGLMDMGINALKEFMVNEPEWTGHLRDDDNWEHLGDDSDGYVVVHRMVTPPGGHGGGSCGCGGSCGGGGSCGCGGQKSAGFGLIDEIETEIKAGRSLSTRNVNRVKQAIEALQQILNETGNGMDAKGYDDLIYAEPNELFDLKQFLDPVLEYHDIDAVVVEHGILIKSSENLSQNAIDALISSVKNFDS